MKENLSENPNRIIENNTEQIDLNLGEEWLGLENKFNLIEQQNTGNENKKKVLKAKLVLKNTSKKILSAVKTIAIRTGISVAVLTGYVAVDLNKQLPFSEKDKAQKEIEMYGIPSDQRISAYKPGISELIYRSVTPFGYQEELDPDGLAPNLFLKLAKLGVHNIGMIQDISANIFLGRENRAEILDSLYKKFQSESKEKYGAFSKKHHIKETGIENFMQNSSEDLIFEFYNLDKDILQKYNKIAHEKILAGISDGRINVPKESPSREDAWSIYLGLSQKNNTFAVSDFKPSTGKEDKYYFKINNFWESFEHQNLEIPFEEERGYVFDSTDERSKEFFNDKNHMLNENNLKGKIDFIKKYGGEKKRVHFSGTMNLRKGEKMRDVMQDQIMGNYTFGIGEDENGPYVYYYDKWDLASKFAENPILKGVGNPYEIYDRLYYNPETFEPVDKLDIKN